MRTAGTYLLLVLGAVATLAPFLLSLATAFKSPKQFASEPVLTPPDPPTLAPGPPREAERREILDLLRRALAGELTERQRTALVGELRGMPQEEIARQLGIGRNALYKLGHDARQRLKARLAAVGVTDEDVRAAFDL